MQPQQALLSQTSNENAAAAPSAKKLLTQHIWVYYKYYIGYVDPENLGSLAFRRGGNNNTINLTRNHVWFKPDGTTDEVDENGIHYYGSWYFGNEDQTLVVATNTTGTYYINTLLLNNYHYNWYYTDIYGVNRYGEYVPFK